MSSQGRWTLALGSLLTVTALGSWGCCSAGRYDTKARILLKVDARLLSSTEPIVISKGKHQEIVWKLQPGSPYTNVAITLGGHPEPFVSCKTEANVCHIACEHGLCFSDSINPLLKVPEPGIYYEYRLEGQGAASSDPGIRIDP
jgi:hypothetical protein